MIGVDDAMRLDDGLEAFADFEVESPVAVGGGVWVEETCADAGFGGRAEDDFEI